MDSIPRIAMPQPPQGKAPETLPASLPVVPVKGKPAFIDSLTIGGKNVKRQSSRSKFKRLENHYFPAKKKVV